MKESYWGYWIVLLGVFVVGVMVLSNDSTTNTTQDYYQLKEVANSAMFDAVDYSYYTQTRQVRMLKEVFVENFIRRFAETTKGSNSYKVDFYDLYESPPKASVKVSTKTGSYVIGNNNSQLDVVNNIDIIVEYTDITEPGKTIIPPECVYYDE